VGPGWWNFCAPEVGIACTGGVRQKSTAVDRFDDRVHIEKSVSKVLVLFASLEARLPVLETVKIVSMTENLRIHAATWQFLMLESPSAEARKQFHLGSVSDQETIRLSLRESRH
jgi:hypothetical protein